MAEKAALVSIVVFPDSAKASILKERFLIIVEIAMKRTIQFMVLFVMGSTLLCNVALAQRGAIGATLERAIEAQREVESRALGEAGENEIEGAIWQFKIIPTTSTKPKETTEGQDAKPAPGAKGKDAKQTPAGGRPKRSDVPLGTALREAREAVRSRDNDPILIDDKGVIRGRIRIKGNAVFQVVGSDVDAVEETRIGDFVMSRKSNGVEYQIRFDPDQELVKGRAVFRADSRTEGGVYPGYYLDENKKRSKFELRRGED